MEFDYYSPSETFVVLTADQFVGCDDGLLEQQLLTSCDDSSLPVSSNTHLLTEYPGHFSQVGEVHF